MRLPNKIAIVTASTKGIGLASSLALAKEGACVYLAARNKTLADEIIDAHPTLNLKYVYFDASYKDSLAQMIGEVFEKEKRIDILVNNFGGNDVKKDKTIFDTTPEDYFDTVQSNLYTTFVLCQEVAKIMKEQKSGSIINISTIGSVNPDVARIGYVTSKAAINSLTQNIAVQAGEYNIRCNAILPGLIKTDAVKNNLNEQFIKIFSSCTPLNRGGEPYEIANTVVFLASDDASYITGQLFEVAGGFGKATPILGLMNMQKNTH